MSQMPDKIWLHKDTKYNTGDVACGYQYEFAQGIEDEGGIEPVSLSLPIASVSCHAAAYHGEDAKHVVFSYQLSEAASVRGRG